MTGGRPARFLLLVAVFVCAACGLVYELALVALGSYLIGDTVGQASIVLGVMVFAMGVGALVAKPLQPRAAAAFALIELTLALLGGLSVLGLYAAFAWLDLYGPALVGTAFVLGLLIGAEIPLLMVMLQRIREQAAGSAVADLFAADYVGALLGGLAFPFLLIPVFGQLKGALVVGAVNAVAGVALVCTVFRGELAAGARVGLRPAPSWSPSARVRLGHRRRLRGDRPPAALPRPGGARRALRYQEIVLTRSVREVGHAAPTCGCSSTATSSSAPSTSTATTRRWCTRRCAGRAARCWSSAPVTASPSGRSCATRRPPGHPGRPRPGGGARWPARAAAAGAQRRLARRPPGAGAQHRRLRLAADRHRRFDVVIADLPDPDETATAEALHRRVLRADPAGARPGRPAGGAVRVAVLRAPVVLVDRGVGPGGGLRHRAVPRRRAVLRRLGFRARRSPTDAHPLPPRLRFGAHAPKLRFLDPQVLRAARVFPKDRRRRDVRASTLMDPAVLQYCRHEWSRYWRGCARAREPHPLRVATPQAASWCPR